VSLYLCDRHEQQHILRAIAVPVLLVGAVIGGTALASMLDHMGFLWISIAAVVAMFFFPRGVVFPTLMTRDRVVLRGASPKFVASLPVWDEREPIETDLHPDLV
jgi:hypothetical protein